jgi:hypothetical protein
MREIMNSKVLIGAMIVGAVALLGIDWWYHLTPQTTFLHLRPFSTFNGPVPESNTIFLNNDKGITLRDLAQLLISAAVMVPSLFVILSAKYVGTDKNWAYATIGTLLGFWLKP